MFRQLTTHTQRGTWIVQPMVRAYTAWHRAGRVHSAETGVDGQLVGGLYFVAIGRMCFGESMFARAADASAASVSLSIWLPVALRDASSVALLTDPVVLSLASPSGRVPMVPGRPTSYN